MEKELVLGIDYGGKYTGLAVIDRRNKQVLYAKTVKMRDDVADILEGRREQRGIRRTLQTKKKRLRELKNYLKRIGYDESTEIFKTVYSLCHKRGYDYADMPEEKTSEEIEAMDYEERKQWEKEEKEWKETVGNSRHREEVLRDVREAMSEGGATEERIKRVERIFNKQYRPKRFNNRILTKCKVCGKNTPLRKNVREFLLENIVRYLPMQDTDKAILKSTILEGQQEKINEIFKKFRKDYKLSLNQKDWPGKNLIDIARNKLPGRLPFCKEHFPDNEKYTKLEKKTFRLAPSLKTKIENVLTVIKEEVLLNFAINRVVMESNNFDIAARTQGRKKLDKEEYAKGTKFSRKERLLQETGGRCIYCGKSITTAETEEEHIYTKKAGSIWVNLVASCRKCNGEKNNRTPIDSGKYPDKDVLDIMKKTCMSMKNGRGKRVLELKIKLLEDALTLKELDLDNIKYMSHSSIGWRHMRDRLKGLTGNEKLPVERQSGIYTAYFRRWWGFKKERGNTAHHALDAVILAARKGYTDDGLVDMTLKPRYKDGGEFDPEKHLPRMREFKRDKGTRGSALYDRNPLSYDAESNIITQRKPITEIECGKEDSIISPEYREKLKEAFKRFGIPDGKCLNDVQAKEAGFSFRKTGNVMSLKCRVAGTGPSQMVKIKNNIFKSNVHNIGVAVYLDAKGKKRAYELKNPRLLKHFKIGQEEIKGNILYKLRRGDIVKYEGEDTIYRIKKLDTSPVLEVIIKGNTEKIRSSASATKLIKVSSEKYL